MKKILFSLLMLCSVTVAWAEGTGDGTKEHPYTGEWQAEDLGPAIKKAVDAGYKVYLDYNCVIQNGRITVYDTKLQREVLANWNNWAPGNILGANNFTNYEEYLKDNSLSCRQNQLFIITGAAVDYDNISIQGYFNGYYGSPSEDGYSYISTAHALEKALKDARARIILMDDIYMSDLGLGESGRHTLCSTFSGILDGDGHTIWAAGPDVQHDGGGHYHRQYLFTYCDGATIKNLTFKDFRVQSEDNYNQAIITSQAKNKCLFDNITLDHVSVFCNKDNVGAVTGYTEDCTFTNITVRNSDFTTDDTQSGAVVGHAKNNCTFTNIKVENCESTTYDGKSGGVAGRTDNCTISNVEILGSFIKTYDVYAGGVAGYSANSHYSDCTVDDQSCVLGKGGHTITSDCIGGIVGYANGYWIHNCINSALIAGYHGTEGGIVGKCENIVIEACLNTGMVVCIDNDDVMGDDGYYSKYKNKQLPCVTKYYNGKKYNVRKTDLGKTAKLYYGGIAGLAISSSITKCANIGSMNKTGATGGILGDAKTVTISDCLNDTSSPEHVYGILGHFGSKVKIINCVNASNTSSYPDKIDEGINLFSVEFKNMTENELAWGKICYQLGEDWEQNIGTDPYPTPTGNRGEYHTRKVSNQYGTVCLPFSVKSDKEIRYYTFSEATEGSGITLKFSYAEGKIPAGTPLLYRVAGFDAIGAEDLPVEICFNYWGPDFTETPIAPESSTWGMEGTFEEKVFDETTDVPSKMVYYVSGGQIKNAKKTTVAPFRAFFHGPSFETLTAAGAKAIRFVIEDEDGETTALEFVGNDLKPVQNGKTYSIMGTEVGENYRGIVIKNGKKYLIK